jgi:hypothetical protein
VIRPKANQLTVNKLECSVDTDGHMYIHMSILVVFPTPIEETTKHLPCLYLGCIYVEKSAGMNILRPAIDNVSTSVPRERWIPVTVNISPTSILICSDDVS